MAEPRPFPTQAEIQRLMVYNPDTGEFTWRINRSAMAKAGDRVGQTKHGGKAYVITVNKKVVMKARAAWLYVYGVLPPVVSHINGIVTDDRICNLIDKPAPSLTKQMKHPMDAEYLRNIMTYKRSTGEFFWKVDRASNCLAGSKVCEMLNKYGYKYITTSGKQYRSHRLAWLYTYGEWPEIIDHINGDRGDNRIINLRSGNARLNSTNMKYHREGHLVGATYVPALKRYASALTINGKIKGLGTYLTAEEAHGAYMKYCTDNDLIHEYV